MSGCTKHWRYHYKGERGCYWATLFLDEKGAFAYVSDAGNGAYGHFYCDDIRHFVAYNLADAPKYPDYLAGKLCKGLKTEFNWEKTYKKAKKMLFYSRRYSPDRVSKELAREAFNTLKWLADYEETEHEWRQHLSDYDFNPIYRDEWYDFLCHDWDPWVISFIENCLPGLQELIKKELEEEACIKEQLVV